MLASGSYDETIKIWGIEETDEVRSSGDRFRKEIPEEVTISGPKDELRTFAQFLKQKGNPHEEQGIVINWEVDD